MADTLASEDHVALEIDAATLQRHVDELGAIGTCPEGGLYRGVYTPSWTEARALVRAWLEELGLATREDAVGNVFGRLAGTESQRVVLSGSHVDTVRQGGKYDGALGIHAAIAAIAALRAAYGPPKKALEVYVGCEEEGSRFHCNFWGARAMTGEIAPHEVDALRDADGTTIGEAMRACGLDPAAIGSARRDDLDAFVELHIEQGRILDDERQDVGVVHTITGQRQLLVRVTGRQDHAGTTPMDLRRDALAGAAEMMTRVTAAAAAMGRPAVATVGTLTLTPGAVNVVPGTCTFTIDTRHADAHQRRQLVAAIEGILREVAAQRGLELDVQGMMDHDPVPLAQSLRDLITTSAQNLRLRHHAMPSGAGHDSQIMAGRYPTGMIFVPSVDGRSHCPEEYTELERIVPGVQVLASTLHQLAY
jgi:allantoate deiminase